MNSVPKILMSSSGLTTGLLWKVRAASKNLAIITEPNLTSIVELAQVENPDLILLDLNPVTEKGLELINQLREEQSAPLLILITIQDTEQVLSIYEAGADDCISKPIEPEVFLAKINAWLRRRMAMPVEMLNTLKAGKIYLDPPNKILQTTMGAIIRLTNIEVRLLYTMMSRPNRPISTDELIELVWKNKEDVCRAILKNTIYRLRQKLESEPAKLRCIITVTGFGYYFDPSGEGKTIPLAALSQYRSVDPDKNN